MLTREKGTVDKSGLAVEFVLLLVVVLVALILRQMIHVRLFPDSVNYLAFAKNVLSGIHHTGEIALTRYRRPPLYPHLIALLSFGNASPIFLMEIGRQVSIYAGIFTLFPLYFWGREFYGKTVAVFSVVGAAVIPEFIYYSGSVLTESLAIFFVTVALCLLWWLGERWGAWAQGGRRRLGLLLFFLGGVLGAAFLTRHAAIGFLVISLVWLFFIIISNIKGANFAVIVQSFSMVLLFVLVGFFVTVAPQSYYLHSETGTWALAIDPSSINNQNLAQAGGEIRYTASYERLDSLTEDAGHYVWEKQEPVGLLSLIVSQPIPYLKAYWKTIYSGYLPDTYPLPYPTAILALALLGGFGLLRERKNKAFLFCLWVFGGYYLFIALFLNFRDRHMFPVYPVLLLLAGVGVVQFAKFFQGLLKRRKSVGSVLLGIKGVLLVLIVLLILPDSLTLIKKQNSMTNTRLYEILGREFAPRLEKEAVMFDRTAHISYFAGQNWTAVPFGEIDDVIKFGRKRGVDYWVVSTSYVPGLRPQFLPLLNPRKVREGLQPVSALNLGPKLFIVIYKILPEKT